MKKSILAIIILLIIAAVLYAYGKGRVINVPNTVNNNPTSYKDLIEVYDPSPGQTISNPVRVSGKARGNWYFEASFPVQVVDSEGNVLGTGLAQAMGEWMTEEYVPFRGEIEFNPPQNPDSNLKIVFKKDNPSGLAENDDSFIVEAGQFVTDIFPIGD